MINFLVSTLVFFLISLPLSAASLKNVEKDLVNLVSQNCKKEAYQLFSFPDIYHSQYNFGSCEYAFINNPQKYAKTYYHHLRAFAYFGRVPATEELKFVDKYYLSENPSGTILNFPEDIQIKITKNRALSGDASSLISLGIENYNLNESEILKLSKFENKKLLEIMFLEINELRQKVPDWETYDQYVSTYIENLHRISGYYRDEIAKKLIDLSLLVSHEIKNSTLFIASLPYKIAKKLLVITSFAPDLTNENIFWSLRIRLYSAREKFNIKDLGFKEFFYKKININVDLKYYSYLINLRNIINGNEVSDLGINNLSPVILLKIQNIEKKYPQIRSDYIKYFPKVAKSKILDLDLVQLNDLFVEYLTGRSNFLSELNKKMLLSDIKVISDNAYVIMAKDRLSYLNYTNFDNKLVKNLLDDIKDPIEKLSFYLRNAKFYLGDNEKTSKYFYGKNLRKIKKDNLLKSTSLIKGLKNNFKLVCLGKSQESCNLLWREIRVGNLNQGTLIKSNLSAGKDCVLQKDFKFFTKKLSIQGSPISEIFYSCSYKKLRDVFNLDKNTFFKKIPYHLISLGFTNGKSFAANEELLVNGGGIIASAIQNANFDDRKIVLPNANKFLDSTSDPKADQFISLINSLKFPKFDSSEIDPTNYSALSEFYKKKGNYERALRATLKSLEKNILDGNGGDTLSQFIAVGDLSTVKTLLRNLEIPDELINSYISFLYTKFKFNPDNLILNDFDTGQTVIKGSWMKEGIRNYLIPNKSKNLSKYLNNLNQEKAILFVTSLIGLSKKEQRNKCLKKSFRENLLKTIRENKKNTLYFGIAMGGIDKQFLTQFNKIYDHCLYLHIEDLSEKNYEKEIKKEFISGIQGLKLLINLKFDYTNPIFLSSSKNFSLLSNKTLTLQGTLLSFLTLKHSYETLAKSFLLNNSNALRLKQSEIETIIVNISDFIEKFSPKNKREKIIYNYLKINLNMIESSSKIIISSNSTRKRFLSLIGSAKEEFFNKKVKESRNYKNYLKLKKYFKKIDKELDNQDNIIDIINTKSKYPDHYLYFERDFYQSYHNLDWIKNQDVIKNGLVKILSVSSTKNSILISEVSDTKTYKRTKFIIDETKLLKLKNSISEKSYLDEDDFKLSCNIFQKIHETFDFSINTFITVVPSVNLFPIPLSVILGTACKGHNIPIIYASDISSAIEFTVFGQKKSFPKSFVGVGNPTLTEDTFDFDIPGVKRSNSKDLSKDDFIPLPDASEEINDIGDYFSNKFLFLDEKASISTALQTAENKSYSAIVLATHGVPFDLVEGYKLPSLLSIEDNKQTLVSASKINKYDLKQSTVFLSACDSASGLLSDPTLFLTGFTEAFANAGSNVIVASLWPVVSKSSKNYSVNFFSGWEKSGLVNGIKEAENAIQKNINKLPFITIYP